jgi:hypothetical protein
LIFIFMYTFPFKNSIPPFRKFKSKQIKAKL